MAKLVHDTSFKDEEKKRVKEKFNNLRRSHSMTSNDMLEILIDFWLLDDTELLIDRVRDKCKDGLTIQDVNNLSILNTYLAQVLRSVY